jgi:hypothetical protein
MEQLVEMGIDRGTRSTWRQFSPVSLCPLQIHMAYSNTSMEQPTSRALLPTCFMLILLLGLFFKAEDGGDMFFKMLVDFQ